ncbi:MAG TPA: alpha/beta hydrolase [Gemmataceae bacterium]|nr:alpha/beta hydrolase [Gemmataceae bacterium]
MRRFSLLTLCLLLAGGGASAGRGDQGEAVRGAAGPAAGATGVVLVADGAGDYLGLTKAVQQAVADAGLPLEVEPLRWSHGYRRSFADQVDRAHIRAQGQRLADKVLALRQACPDRPVYLMAHSAGAAVVLAAAPCLPPDSVERIVLLAPTVSAHADIRPALLCARQGMDVFYSHRDQFAWVVAFTLIGTEGRLCPRIAARVGFLEPSEPTADEQVLFLRLHQHAWEPCQRSFGHDGGHYGACQQGFLHAHVLPLLTVH